MPQPTSGSVGLIFIYLNSQSPGFKNSNADALSCCDDTMHLHTPEPILQSSVIIMPKCWDLIEKILQAQLTKSPPLECPPTKQYLPTKLGQLTI